MRVSEIRISLILNIIFSVISINLFAEKLFVPPDFPEVEIIKYRAIKKTSTNPEIIEKKLIKTNIRGEPYFKIYTHSSEGFKRIELLNKNLITVKFFQIDNGIIERKFEIHNKKIHLIVPPENINKSIKINKTVYDIKSLQYVLRGYPWDKSCVKFNIILNNGRIVRVCGRNLGIYKIKIPAGKFPAYKILIEPSSSFIKLVYRTKVYLYFSTKSPFPFLKYEDSNGDIDEVIRITTFSRKEVN